MYLYIKQIMNKKMTIFIKIKNNFCDMMLKRGDMMCSICQKMAKEV